MSETERAILFVGHEATRTGAPIELLHFLRWFKKHGNRPFSILLDRGGELAGAFEQLGDSCLMERGSWSPERRSIRMLRHAGLGALALRAEARATMRFAVRSSPALVYVNTIAGARALDNLTLEVPILTHVHELDFIFSVQPKQALSRLLTKSKRFMACSLAVKENLVHNYGVCEASVDVVYEAIPIEQFRVKRTRDEVFTELGIPSTAQLVAASGYPDWRKGADLFLQVAQLVCRQRPGAYFVWIGGGDAVDVARFQHDCRLGRIAKNVRLTNVVASTADYIGSSDVFVLPSREDPYPLVCLEAAALAKPIVCFDNAGGIPEFVEHDCGFMVPYLDVRAMADRVLTLLDSEDLRLMMGGAARRKVAERHDISSTAPRIMEIIERTIAGG
jgi:glycosyltransferase involved in cell wall biosynthesis